MTRTKEAFYAPWQAAEYAGLKLDSLYEMLESGEITGEKFEGNWRIRKTALDEWLDAEVSEEELERLKSQMRDPIEDEEEGDPAAETEE